jgi:hypothetical protein
MNAPGGDSFDQWLGQELQQHAAAHRAPSPMPAQAQYHAAYLKGGLHVPMLAKVAAVLTTKAALAATVGVLVAAAAGEAVVTGSVNPADWGQQVVQQVQKCKDAIAPGSHGIGDCVSSFASQHGKKAGSDHRANPTPGQGQGNGSGNANGNGNGHTPTPPDKNHPTPPGQGGPHPTPPDKVHPTPPGNGHQ